MLSLFVTSFFLLSPASNTVWLESWNWIQFIVSLQVFRISWIISLLQEQILYCMTSIKDSMELFRTSEKNLHSVSGKKERTHKRNWKENTTKNKVYIKPLPFFLVKSWEEILRETRNPLRVWRQDLVSRIQMKPVSKKEVQDLILFRFKERRISSRCKKSLWISQVCLFPRLRREVGHGFSLLLSMMEQKIFVFFLLTRDSI